MIKISCLVFFVGCSMEVHIKSPVIEIQIENTQDAVVVDLTKSKGFAPGDLEYKYRFVLDGEKVGKEMGYDNSSKKIQAYEAFALPNGGTIYISGTYEKAEVVYVGGPVKSNVEFCIIGKDVVGQTSKEKCQTILFETGDDLAGQSTYTVGGTVAGLVGTLVLRNNGGDDLTINANGAFVFSTGLIDEATYEVTVQTLPAMQGCTVTDGTGSIASSNITNITVLCIGKSWTHPADLNDSFGPNGIDVSVVDVAMDNNGNAIVFWSQGAGFANNMFISEYRNGVWTHPVDNNDYINWGGTNTTYPSVAMDDNGNAILAWMDYDGVTNQIFMSEYRNGAWDHPVDITDNIISPGVGWARNPKVAMDNNGNAIITWQQFSGGGQVQIFKSEYRSGAWTHPADVNDYISPGASGASEPQVAMDDNGNAIIAWSEFNGGFQTQIFKSEYRNGAWTHPANNNDHISIGGSNATLSDIAMDDNGNAIITWYQVNGAGWFQIFKSEYRSGAWVHPANSLDDISPDGGHAFSSRLAMDNNGNAIITWQQPNGGSSHVYKSEYRSGAWTHPADINDNMTTDIGNGSGAQVAMDNNGNAIITYTRMDGLFVPMSYKSEYRNGAWTHPTNVADSISPPGSNTMSALPAMDDNSNAIIVSSIHDGANTLLFKSEYR